MSKSAFATYLSAERNYSNNTVSAYINDLAELEDYVNPKSLSELSKKDIKRYLAHLIGCDLKERSINRKISSIQAYYKFLLLIGDIEILPTSGIKSLKFFKKVQIPISQDEINSLLDKTHIGDSFSEIRDYLIIQLLYYTGMRRAELINLTIQNINLNKLELKVKGKRDKERIIPITQELANAIESYIKKCYDEGIDLNDALLVTEKGRKMYPKLVYNIVNSYLSLVTNKEKKSPHILRHSFASHFLHNGAEINAVKEILGHESLAATQNYTHNDIEQLKKVFNQTHPRESKNE